MTEFPMLFNPIKMRQCNNFQLLQEHINILFYFICGIFIIYPFSIITKAKIYFIFTLFIAYYVAIIGLFNSSKLIIILRKNIYYIFLYISFLLSYLWSIYPTETLKSAFFHIYFVGLLLILSYYLYPVNKTKIATVEKIIT